MTPRSRYPLSIWPGTRHCGDELGKYSVAGTLENLSAAL